MKRLPPTATGAAAGAIAAGAPMLIMCVLIRSLGKTVGSLAPALGLAEDTAGQISAALSQLSGAQITPPVLPALLTGAALGAILTYNGKHIVLKAIAIFVAFAPFCLWNTDVNAIRFGAAVHIVLDMLQAGVF